MKILFVYPNTIFEGCLPINVSILSACLKKEGHQTALFDTSFFEVEGESSEKVGIRTLEFKDIKDKGKVWKDKGNIEIDFVKKIDIYQPQIIAFSNTSFLHLLSRKLLKIIKDNNILVVVGGIHPTISPDEVMNEENVDVICIGEGEEAIVELVNNLRKKKDITKIKNLWVKNGNKIYKNEIRPLLQDLDSLPYLDWDIFDDRQFWKGYEGQLYRFGHYMMSRGCPFFCTYCVNQFLQNLNKGSQFHREYSIERATDELAHLKKKYKLNMIKFWDESFLATSDERLVKFKELYLKIVNLPFIIQTRPETITEKRVKILKESGCVAVSMGIESGDYYIRHDILNRNVSAGTIIKAFSILNKAEIRTSAFNMLGLPYETRRGVFRTILLNRLAKPTTSGLGLFYPFKGTKLREVCLKEGYIKGDEEPVNLRNDTILNMPQLSRKQLLGLYKTFSLYIKAPKLLFPLLRMAENDNKLASYVYNKIQNYYMGKMNQ